MPQTTSEDWDKQLAGLPVATRDALRAYVAGEQKPSPPSWWLVIVEELSPDPVLRSFDSIESLAAAMRELPASAISLPFFGIVLRAAADAQSGLRYLERPDGELLPLFSSASELTLEAPGFVRTASDISASLASLVGVAASESDDLDDEDDDAGPRTAADDEHDEADDDDEGEGEYAGF